MRPQLPQVLGGFLQSISEDIMPHIGTEYAQKEMEIILLSLMAAAEESDRGAEVRVRDNEDLRALFSRASKHLSDDTLKKRLSEAASTTDESLRVSDLDAANDKLLALLIELHERVENTDDDRARSTEAEIWEFLGTSTQRRAISFYPM